MLYPSELLARGKRSLDGAKGRETQELPVMGWFEF